jgi:hypothetical protein
MTEKFIGGAQTPLVRGLLRAAVVTTQHMGHSEFQFNDSDSPGIVGTASGPLYKVAFEKSKDLWLPLTWQFPFRPDQMESHLETSLPKNSTIAGLPFQKISSLILGQTMLEADSLVFLLDTGSVRKEIGNDFVNQCMDRALYLKNEALQIAVSSETLQEFWFRLGSFMLGDSLKGVKLISSVNDFGDWNQKRLWLFSRMLNNTEEFMNQYCSVSHSSLKLLPYFIFVHNNEKNQWVREQLFFRSGGYYVGTQHVGDKHQIHDMDSFWQHAQNYFEHVVRAVPKVLPLMVTLRSLGTVCVSDPPYMEKANQFARILGVEQSEIVKIEFDMTEYVPPIVWQALERRAAELSDQKIDWRKSATLTFLYLLGEETLLKALSKASVSLGSA